MARGTRDARVVLLSRVSICSQTLFGKTNGFFPSDLFICHPYQVVVIKCKQLDNIGLSRLTTRVRFSTREKKKSKVLVEKKRVGVSTQSIRPRKHPPASRTLRLAKAPSHSRRPSFRSGRMFAMSSSTAAGAVRAGPTSARVSRKTTVSAMAGRVAPARVSVRARASSVMGARVVTARYVRQSRRNLRNASSRAVDRDRARLARPASPRAFPASALPTPTDRRNRRDRRGVRASRDSSSSRSSAFGSLFRFFTCSEGE